jgi:hypothetical protein
MAVIGGLRMDIVDVRRVYGAMNEHLRKFLWLLSGNFDLVEKMSQLAIVSVQLLC